MARLYRQRPSALLGIPDPYVAYCVDEAAAWLLSQKEEPTYGDAPGKGRASKAVFNTAQHLRIVEKYGGDLSVVADGEVFNLNMLFSDEGGQL